MGHIVELSRNLSPYLAGQFLVTRKYYDENYDDRIYEEISRLEIYREDMVRWLPAGRIQSISFIPFAIRRVLWLDKKFRISLIQAHCIWTGIAAFFAGKILKRPVVWMAHGTDEAYGRIQGLTETLVSRIFRPDHVLVLDDGSNAPRKFRRILGDKKVTIVYHGIDLDTFNPKHVDPKLESELKLNDDFIVTTTSLLIPVKNVDRALSAFSEFLRTNKIENATLLIIGEGPLRNQLEKMAFDLGIKERVRFLGKVEHVKIRDYLAISDVVIATSSHSNVNRSTLEAMASAKPVIVFDGGNARQVFTHMKNCLLVKDGNIGEFARELSILYADPKLRRLLGDKGREFVEKKRSWASRIETELAVFRELVQENTPTPSFERNS